MKPYFLFSFIIATASLFGQEIQVNRQNKTIAVSADDSVTADAEVAVLEIGYHNYAPTEDTAFRENVRVADKVTKALLDAMIPRASIETAKLRLSRPQIDEKWTEGMKKERQFEAEQSWHITVAASQAEAVADLAVRSGANELNDIEWNVADPVALQAKAGRAALAKAKVVAEQMATGLGAKLGELVYARNHAEGKADRMLGEPPELRAPPPPPPAPNLSLFPQKVKTEATVYAVFSIE